MTLARVSILGGDGTGSAIGASQTVRADDEKPRSVKGSTGTTEKGTPPVTNISAASEGMADHHGIVAVGGERAPGCVGHGNIVKRHARLEGERGDYGELLVRDESRKRILRLRLDSFLEVFSHRFLSLDKQKEVTQEEYGQGD